MNLFGPLFDGTRIEAAAKDTLVTWLPSYLAEVERQADIPAGALPQPGSWIVVPDSNPQKWPEDRLPCIALLCPGLAGQPQKHGDGKIRARWVLAVAVFLSARTAQESEQLVKLYVAAVRGVLLQHRSLGIGALAVDWIDESYDDLPFEKSRSLGLARVVFAVEVPEAMNSFGGLTEPPEDPLEDPGDWPPAVTIEVDVDLKETE